MKKVLIISYLAGVDTLAPSHHIDNRLPLLGEKSALRLISSPCGRAFTTCRHIRVPSVAPSGIRYEIRHFLRRRTSRKLWFKFWETLLLLPVLPFYLLEKIFLRLDSTWSWFLPATVAAIVSILRNKPDIIYSTGGPVSAHVAALTASRITGVPCIVEFQDPAVFEYAAPGRLERQLMESVERSAFRRAVRVLFLTRNAAGDAMTRHPQYRDKAVTLYAGAPVPKERFPYERGEKCSFAHFGSLAGSRDLQQTFRALDILFKEKPHLADSFVLHLYGNLGRNVKRQVEGFRHPRVLRVHGKIGKDESLRLIQQADVLLLIQNTDSVSFMTIPSKVYEYLHARRPVLALVYRNPELQEMLGKRGHRVVQADDAVAIGKAIGDYLELWARGAADIICEEESSYTTEGAVTRLLDVIGECT